MTDERNTALAMLHVDPDEREPSFAGLATLLAAALIFVMARC
jgi:hypothetical protein